MDLALSNLVRTMQAKFRIGNTTIKDVSGVVSIRNAADSTDAALKASEITLVNNAGDGKELISDSNGLGVWTTPIYSDAYMPYNAIINGGMTFAQPQFLVEGTLTSYANDTYCTCDGWYVLTQTAAIQTQRTTGDTQSANSLRLSQSQVTAQRMGVAQIIEGYASYPYKNKVTTLKARIKCSSSQPIRVAMLQWTGTVDSVTSNVVNSWTSGIFTAGNFFLGASLTVVSVGTVTPSAATWTDISLAGQFLGTGNIIIMYWTEGTAAQNVTLDITEVQLVSGWINPTWMPFPFELERQRVLRLFRVYGGESVRERICMGQGNGTTAFHGILIYDVPQRLASPVLSVSANADWCISANGTGTTAAFTGAPTVVQASTRQLGFSAAAVVTAASTYFMTANNTVNARFFVDSRL